MSTEEVWFCVSLQLYTTSLHERPVEVIAHDSLGTLNAIIPDTLLSVDWIGNKGHKGISSGHARFNEEGTSQHAIVPA